ncbi:MFS transporter [Staphylococcus aureus]|nr:MFS transporter [Staphylococcus aureus]MCC1344729.1 MFS transporter [Staphylococcus aureus]
MNIPKSVWWLVIGMALNITGSSFLWPLNTIYMKQELGKSLTVAGLVLMINSFGMVIGNLLGGSLFDKLGGYKTILIGTFTCLCSTTLLNFFHGWPWYAVGAAMGGFVAEFSFNYIFLANLIMYVVFALVAVTQFNIEINAKVKYPTHLDITGKKNKARFISLVLICAMFAICWVAYIQWESTIASFTQSINISMAQYSVLWTINGIMILVAQPLIKPVLYLLKGNLKKQMFVGIIIFMLSFFVTSFAENFTIFVVGMIILTFGEMFVWPAVPTIANQLAPDGKQGQYQGFVNSAATVGKAFGPFLGGVLVDAFNMRMMFIGMMLLLVFALILLMVFKENNTQPKKIDA